MSDDVNPGAPRPVIALMGEFSAGKSTLANLLLGKGHSPVKVTATQLPPVWFAWGDQEPYKVGLDGTETPISLDRLEEVSVEDTAHIRIFLKTEILEIMDLIDMPGNSDPNMSAEVWQRAVHLADGVIWCSHANQAWRQSEAAVWEEIPEEIYQNSVLLLTRFDKILGEKDRMRVLRRVCAEAEDLFRGVFPISLVQALEAGNDRAQWDASGADEFLQALLDIVLNFVPAGAEPQEDAEFETEPKADAISVMPRRVAAAGDTPRQRPERQPESPSVA